MFASVRKKNAIDKLLYKLTDIGNIEPVRYECGHSERQPRLEIVYSYSRGFLNPNYNCIVGL
jgi:hypothetical protein